MKKIFALILIFFLIFDAFAQTESTSQSTKTVTEKSYNALPARRANVGLVVGPTFNWFNWKNAESRPDGYKRPASNNVYCGIRYGLKVDIDLNMKKNFFFTTGVMAEHTGGSLVFTDFVYLPNNVTLLEEIERRYKSIYISMPTAITFRTPSFGNSIIQFNLGLYHGFLVYSQYQSSFDIDPEAKDTDKETINNVTTGWAKDDEVALFKESVFCGIGYEYVIKNNLKATFCVNYAQSLNNYFSKNAKNSAFDTKEEAAIGSIELIFGISF